MHRLLEELRDDIVTATAGLTDAQLRFHSDGKWCGGEILEHLSLTFAGTIRGAERCLNAGRPTGSLPNFTDRLRAFVVTTLGVFPPGRDAPRMVVPTGATGGREAVDAALRNVETMDRLLAQCESAFGGRVKVFDHPVLGPLSVGQWRRFHRVHTRHHMKQVAGLRRLQAR